MPPIPALTGIRGLAALLVFTGHVAQQYFLGRPGAATFSYGAYIGMTVFFTLSGFVIHWNYSALFSSNSFARAWWHFFIARFARLYPMHFAIVLLALALTPETPPMKAILHLLMTQMWFYPEGGINPAFYNTWSISTEWFCYLAYGAMIVWGIRYWRFNSIFLFFTVIAASLFIHAIVGPAKSEPDMWLRYLSPYLRVLEFATGAAAAQVCMDKRQHLPHLDLLVMLVAAITFLAFQRTTFGNDIVINYLFAPLTAVTLIAATDRLSLFGALLSSHWLCWVGDRSYSFYLLQSVVMVHVGRHVSQPLGLATAILLTLAVGISIAILSDLSWRYYEEPTRRFFNRWRKPAQLSA
jgi:peptidoglycan/LPS O-acetylase OafA/YrhL